MPQDADPRSQALALAAALGAMLAIAATTWLPQWPLLYVVAKPLTTIVIIVMAWGRGEPGSALRRAVLAGLVLSLTGDIALLWPQQGFLPGLVAFLLAHLAYLVAFTRGTRLAARPLAFLGYAALAGAILAALWPGVPVPLRVPVVVYVAALAAMAAQAASRWIGSRGQAGEALARRAAVGAALFVLSDAMLATNRFALPLPAPALWILPAYWVAQWLIASSLPPRR